MITDMDAAAVLDRMLEPVSRSLNGEAARALVELKVESKVQRRIDALAEKCNEGELTPAERLEYESYVSAGSIISILRAQARLHLLKSPSP